MANRTDQPFGVELRRQRLVWPDGRRLPPEDSGYETVPAGTTRTITLRYDQPRGDRFELEWQVETAEGPIGRGTRFARAQPNRVPNDQPAAVPGAPQTTVTPAIPGTAPSPVPPSP